VTVRITPLEFQPQRATMVPLPERSVKNIVRFYRFHGASLKSVAMIRLDQVGHPGSNRKFRLSAGTKVPLRNYFISAEFYQANEL